MCVKFLTQFSLTSDGKLFAKMLFLQPVLWTDRAAYPVDSGLKLLGLERGQNTTRQTPAALFCSMWTAYIMCAFYFFFFSFSLFRGRIFSDSSVNEKGLTSPPFPGLEKRLDNSYCLMGFHKI